jgi:hypothetical protein
LEDRKTRYNIEKDEKTRQGILVNREEKTREEGMTPHSTITTLRYHIIIFWWGY